MNRQKAERKARIAKRGFRPDGTHPTKKPQHKRKGNGHMRAPKGGPIE